MNKSTKNEQVLVLKNRLSQHEFLFRNYFKPLVVYATRFVGDRQDAEDIVQDVFARLWSKEEAMTDVQTITSYLFVAVKNSCLNKQRHLKVRHRYENYMKYDNHMVEENPHHYLMLKEIEECIDDALNKLPQRTQDIFLLSRYERKKHKEIAENLNISIKTVEVHISKVLSVLRGKLKNYLGVIVILLLNL